MPAPQDDVIERTLPPHKSWRELPPTPPLGVPLPPPEATQTFAAIGAEPVGAPVKTKRGRKVLAACVGAVVGAAAVAGVFAVATHDDNQNDASSALPSLVRRRRTTPSPCRASSSRSLPRSSRSSTTAVSAVVSSTTRAASSSPPTTWSPERTTSR